MNDDSTGSWFIWLFAAVLIGWIWGITGESVAADILVAIVGLFPAAELTAHAFLKAKSGEGGVVKISPALVLAIALGLAIGVTLGLHFSMNPFFPQEPT